jgi:hypothetical protein
MKGFSRLAGSVALFVIAAAVQLNAQQLNKVKGMSFPGPNGDNSLAAVAEWLSLGAAVRDGAGAGGGGPVNCGIESNGLVACGETVLGRLEPGDNTFADGSFFDVWILTLPAGSEVTISQTSPAVDSFVAIFRPEPDCGLIGFNDDCGGVCCNSCLTVDLNAGTYLVVANTFAGGEIGPYSIQVECRTTVHPSGVPAVADWGMALLALGVFAAGAGALFVARRRRLAAIEA